MNKKINCVLLVDDDESTNFIHKYVIAEAKFSQHIETAENGKEALNYLRLINGIDCIKPDLIFLDINMPVMNCWQFLDSYNQLGENIKSQIMIVMLTSSHSPKDKINAEFNDNVDLFMQKPLTVERLQKLQVQFFDFVF